MSIVLYECINRFALNFANPRTDKTIYAFAMTHARKHVAVHTYTYQRFHIVNISASQSLL